MSVFISHDRLVNCLASVSERFKFAELCLWRVAPNGAEPVRFDPDHMTSQPGEIHERQTQLTADPRRLVGYQKHIEAGQTFTLAACDGGLLVVPSPMSSEVTPVVLVASPSDHLTAEQLAALRSEVARLATLLALYDAGAAALVNGSRQLHFLLDAVPAMIWVAERQKQRTYFNRAWLAFTGRTPSEECADGWMTGVHPDDVGRCIEVYGQAFETVEPFSVDYRLRRCDGTYRWIGETAVPWMENGGLAGFIGSALDVTERRKAEDVARELSGRLIVAQESERRRIAREVHDDLSQRAALLAIELERFADDSPPSGNQITKRSTELAHAAAELAADLHRLSHRLHPAKLEALGLVASIQGFCRELWSQHAFQVQFDHRDVPTRVPTNVSLCLYRIVQEGLLNVLKHSGTRKAGVELIGHGHELLLRIADPGRGFERTRRAAVGLGLSSMRERVRSLGGDFVVHTAPGYGTRIGVRVRVNTDENVREKQSA